MAKKIIISLVITIILAGIFYNYAAKHYNAKKIIADYTSEISDAQQIKKVKSFPRFAASYTLSHMKGMIIIDVLFTLVYTFVMYKKKIFDKKKDVLFSIFMIVLPLTMPFFIMYLSLSYTI